MPATYTCPHCKATLRTGNPLRPGRSVVCPKCTQSFVTAPAADDGDSPAVAGALKLADAPPPPKRPAAKPKPEPAPEPVADKALDDDEEDQESVRRGYGVHDESEEEIARFEANKPKFGSVADKFARSARGPAMAMLVQPSNLLTLEGFATAVGGIGLFIFGMWPLVFADGEPMDEEVTEGLVMMLGALMVFAWGAIICVGASQMTNLESYTWATVGAVMGILPLLAGVYALAMLRNPKVIAGFEEGEPGDADEKEEADKDDEDEEDEEEDEKPRAKKRKG